jgi:hypothetical protein
MIFIRCLISLSDFFFATCFICVHSEFSSHGSAACTFVHEHSVSVAVVL